MKTIRTATHYATVLLLALAANVSPAQSGPSVAVELRTPPTIHLARAVPMVVLVRNTDPQHRRVVLRGQLGFSQAGGLELVIIDSQGTRRSIAPTPGDMTLEEARTGSRRVVLDAGHGMGIQRRTQALDMFPTVGHYQVQVNYRSPMPVNGNPSVIGDEVEGSEATSNVVDVEVVQ